MLRIHCPQQWYQLSDPAMEDVLYENLPMRRFSGLSLDAAIPDHISRVDRGLIVATLEPFKIYFHPSRVQKICSEKSRAAKGIQYNILFTK